MNNIDYDEFDYSWARYRLWPILVEGLSTENSSTNQGFTQDLGVEPPVYSKHLDGADEPNQVPIETEPKDYQRINRPRNYRYPYPFISNTLDSADEPKDIETEWIPPLLPLPKPWSYRHQVINGLDHADEPNEVQIETEPKDFWIRPLPKPWSYRHQVITGLDHADEPNEVQIETKRNQGLPWFSYEDQVSAFKVSQVPSSQAGEDDQWNKQLTIDDLHEVLSALIDANLDWLELGLALKIKVSTLEGINSNKGKNTDKACMREMLAHWLRSSSSRTWSDICKGLRSETVQQDVLADAIERKYQGTGTGMSRKKRKTSSM